IALAAASLAVIRLQPLVFTATMGLGSVSWLAGNLFTLAGWPFHELALWWVGFPTLTIAGERLQLSRIVAATGRRELAFQAVIGLFLAGTVLSVLARG
ncbi:MAG: hypothetical protein GWN54_01830, partial [Gammaproteobacteria bacterium]|nr:hypothetical protein [Gemmatimonadota bacterium]NIT66523.1 hypothetical protein [Gemmatimonadota bacterium]NIV19401.1 hypothetical protein [Gammaproteobacteria bacterium]NIW74973.1 hypothetical protein [Gemmatimonadota bacterium]NIY35100.1 hypothetical protein [Gemmatimonadota bacterium]